MELDSRQEKGWCLELVFPSLSIRFGALCFTAQQNLTLLALMERDVLDRIEV